MAAAPTSSEEEGSGAGPPAEAQPAKEALWARPVASHRFTARGRQRKQAHAQRQLQHRRRRLQLGAQAEAAGEQEEQGAEEAVLKSAAERREQVADNGSSSTTVAAVKAGIGLENGHSQEGSAASLSACADAGNGVLGNGHTAARAGTHGAAACVTPCPSQKSCLRGWMAGKQRGALLAPLMSPALRLPKGFRAAPHSQRTRLMQCRPCFCA